jgi:putative FmdB family regulatory protein
MPLYEYRCDACGHTFEVIQRFSDAPIAVCPVCGGAVEKLLSSPAIHFKGSGWYVTDYPKKDSGRPSPGSKGSNGTSSASESKESKESKSTSESDSGKKSSESSSSSSATTKADAPKKD